MFIEGKGELNAPGTQKKSTTLKALHQCKVLRTSLDVIDQSTTIGKGIMSVWDTLRSYSKLGNKAKRWILVLTNNKLLMGHLTKEI